MLAAMGSSTEQEAEQEVYVRLLDEGTSVYRPVLAISRGQGIYQLIASPDYDPDNEHWEFPPDSLVRCEERYLQDGQCLVAYALA